MKIYPHELAAQYLAAIGVSYDAIYNDDDGIKRAQLNILSGAFFYRELKKNAYKTIHRLHASANRKNLDFAANLKNTLEGTVSAGLMETLDSSIPVAEQKKIMGTWLPSSADEQDPFHALNYGKTMSLYEARKRGLGTRWGCQCGFEVKQPNGVKSLDNFTKSIMSNKTEGLKP